MPGPTPSTRIRQRMAAAAAVLGLVAVFGTATGVQARPTAPHADTGPDFSTTQEARDAALDCPAPLAGATDDPVLLIHGTTFDPESNFAWNWAPALTNAGIPWCTVALVDNGMGDIQDSAEHVVHAIRTMAGEAGRPVDIVGHSQGGMIGRWAVKWWPDTRRLVDDLVGLAPSNHGTQSAEVTCVPGCAPAIHQQRAGAQFIAALNAGGETFAGVDYTVAYTRYDGVVTPNQDDTGSSALRTGDGSISNVLVQDVCPLSVADHLSAGTYDAVTYAIGRDALDHDGPADPARIAPDVCTEPFMPGVDPATFATDYAAALAVVTTTIATTSPVPAEPPLRCYVTASCAAGDADTTSPPPTSEGRDEGPAPVTGAVPAATTGQLPTTGAGVPWVMAMAIGSAGAALILVRRRI